MLIYSGSDEEGFTVIQFFGFWSLFEQPQKRMQLLLEQARDCTPSSANIPTCPYIFQIDYIS